MTRVNVVPVQELTHPELSGEWKEISRLFSLVHARVAKGQRPTDIKSPNEYKLGSGHQLFFYTRLGYIVDRMFSLADEMLNRGYNPSLDMLFSIVDGARQDIPPEWFGNYTPTPEAIQLNIQRMIDNGTR